VQEVSVGEGQTLVACQPGRYIEIDGRMWVEMIRGHRTYDAACGCKESACPDSATSATNEVTEVGAASVQRLHAILSIAAVASVAA
jgi:hypothetical protein